MIALEGESVADVQRYVDAIIESDWWTTRSSTSRIVVKDGRRRRSACATWGEIRMPRWSRTPETILHELAHHLAGIADHGHDGYWKAAYVALARRFGPETLAPYLIRSWEGQPHGKWRGKTPKPIRAPRRETCAGCGKTARRLGWVARFDGTTVRARLCSRRCAREWFERGLEKRV